MARRLQFKQRIRLPEWDGEHPAISERSSVNRVFAAGALVWSFTLALGILIQWFKADVGNLAEGLSSHVAEALAEQGSETQPLVQARTLSNPELAPAVAAAQAGSAELEQLSRDPEPEMQALRSLDDSAGVLGSVEPELEGPEGTPAPAPPPLLSEKQRRVALEPLEQVDIVSWSGTQRLFEQAERFRQGSHTPASDSIAGLEDFGDRELLEDLRPGIMRGGLEPAVDHRSPNSSPERSRSELDRRLPKRSTKAPAKPLREVRRRPTRASSPAGLSGLSCEAARSSYSERIQIGKKSTAIDTPLSAYQAVLNRGAYFAGCRVPPSVAVRICAAVQHGRAVGVTVGTEPRTPSVHACVARGVRGLRFPNNQRLDVVTTRFEAQD